VYQKSGCASCHAVDGQGGGLGPDLSAIGATRGPEHLRQSLVEPAAAHQPGYLVARAVDADGKTVRGILVNEDVFWILLRDLSGTVPAVARTDKTHLEGEPAATLMPSYASRLSATELDDVVAYLSTLRGER